MLGDCVQVQCHREQKCDRQACLTRIDELGYEPVLTKHWSEQSWNSKHPESCSCKLHITCLPWILVFYLHESTLWKIHKSFARLKHRIPAMMFKMQTGMFKGHVIQIYNQPLLFLINTAEDCFRNWWKADMQPSLTDTKTSHLYMGFFGGSNSAASSWKLFSVMQYFP